MARFARIDSQIRANRLIQGVFAEKGARFRGKRGLANDYPPTPGPSPPFSWGVVGVLLKIPGGGGPGVSTGNLRVSGGGAEAPFAVKMGPLFGENTLFSRIVSGFPN